MDVVYPYRRPWDEFELRYSLRSVSTHVRHGRVIVSGDPPKFTGDSLIHVPVSRHADRFASSTRNIVEGVTQAGISGDFIVMNDDMFILKDWKFRQQHRGTIDEYLAEGNASGGYRVMVECTKEILLAHGVKNPKFYGMHKPTVFNAAKLVDLVREFEGQSYLLRTLYGNLYPARSVKCDDVKMHKWTVPPAGDVFSTSDRCARALACRNWLKVRFPHPSMFEQ